MKHFTYKPISIKIVWCILYDIVFRDERSDFGLTFFKGVTRRDDKSESISSKKTI